MTYLFMLYIHSIPYKKYIKYYPSISKYYSFFSDESTV